MNPDPLPAVAVVFFREVVHLSLKFIKNLGVEPGEIEELQDLWIIDIVLKPTDGDNLAAKSEKSGR